MLPSWIKKYIGIPFLERGRDAAGCDCWGLFRLVQMEQYGIELPEYLEYRNLCDDMAMIRVYKAESKRWDSIMASEAGEGDAILFMILGNRYHVGVVVIPGWFLHISRGIGAACETYESSLWRGRILGFFRYNYGERAD